ncbi:MAG: thioesterase family protein [Christensenellales bacterium]|jgi:fluoroacetyl-CoA thioesterase|nr:thioesterase superfamily [Clostridium sp. CAG:253]
MLKTGIKGHQELVVTQELTAKNMGSGVMDVFATPAMLALMEKTAFTSVAEYLNEGCGSVGTKVDIEHVASSPVGMKITCDSELIEIEGRKLVFKVEAYDEKGLIGKGTHERFIVENKKFQEKTDNKLAK